jgi:GNAT superfamily N-acetyltransferase
MDRDLPRAFDFILRADMAGTRTEPFRFGTAVSMPECPRRHDSNYLLVLAPVPEAAALAAEADRIQGAAGLRHRCAFFRDAAEGERLAPEFEALGWSVFRGLVMALRRPPEQPIDLSRAMRTDAAALRAARQAEILRYPWGTPEVARQLLGARAFIPVETRHFAVFEQGIPASWAELYIDGPIAQIEAVATEERFRKRGFASAVVLRAAEEARTAGADFVFLCCDAADRPKDLYRRLGFDEIGRYVKFTRAGGEGRAP